MGTRENIQYIFTHRKSLNLSLEKNLQLNVGKLSQYFFFTQIVIGLQYL